MMCLNLNSICDQNEIYTPTDRVTKENILVLITVFKFTKRKTRHGVYYKLYCAIINDW